MAWSMAKAGKLGTGAVAEISQFDLQIQFSEQWLRITSAFGNFITYPSNIPCPPRSYLIIPSKQFCQWEIKYTHTHLYMCTHIDICIHAAYTYILSPLFSLFWGKHSYKPSRACSSLHSLSNTWVRCWLISVASFLDSVLRQPVEPPDCLPFCTLTLLNCSRAFKTQSRSSSSGLLSKLCLSLTDCLV